MSSFFPGGLAKISLETLKDKSVYKIIDTNYFPARLSVLRRSFPTWTKTRCEREVEIAKWIARSKAGPEVLGVSPDNVSSHDRFRTKYDLNFPLLADTDHQVAEAYGAWREKTRFGKTSMGIQRSTFLIDPEGIVRKAWTDVRVDGHDEEVVGALKELKAGAHP
jgi:peroxiredoxin